jgi:hypothetical protein
VTIANLPSTTLIDNMISTGGVQTSVNGLTIQNGLTTNLVSSKSATGEEVIIVCLFTILIVCFYHLLTIVCLQSFVYNCFDYNWLFTILCLHLFVYNCLFTTVCLQLLVYNCWFTTVCLQLFVYNCLFIIFCLHSIFLFIGTRNNFGHFKKTIWPS